jgi:alpha-1,2-mannosyltransferase
MPNITPHLRRLVLPIFFVVYLTGAIFTLVQQIMALPFPLSIFMDFGFYEQALQRTLSGGDMYAVRSIGEAYLYPPPALLVVDVLNLIPEFYLRVAFWGALNFLMAVTLVYTLARRYKLELSEVWYWFPLTLGFAPLWVTVEFGQINMLTQFGVLLMFLHETTLTGGIGLGLAIMTKVTPLFFGAYLLATRNIRALLWTAVTLLVLAAVALLRYGVKPFITYIDVFRELTNTATVGAGGQSLIVQLLPILGVEKLGLIQFGLTFYLLMVILLAAYVTFRSGRKEPSFIVTSLAMMLSPNIMWYHHYVFFLLPLLIWMGWQRRSQAVTIWCMAGMLLIQFDYFLLSHGLLVHVFGHLSILIVLVQGMASRSIALRTQQTT